MVYANAAKVLFRVVAMYNGGIAAQEKDISGADTHGDGTAQWGEKGGQKRVDAQSGVNVQCPSSNHVLHSRLLLLMLSIVCAALNGTHPPTYTWEKDSFHAGHADMSVHLNP